jgi:hypothetical protein
MDDSVFSSDLKDWIEKTRSNSHSEFNLSVYVPLNKIDSDSTSKAGVLELSMTASSLRDLIDAMTNGKTSHGVTKDEIVACKQKWLKAEQDEDTCMRKLLEAGPEEATALSTEDKAAIQSARETAKECRAEMPDKIRKMDAADWRNK